MDELPGVDVVRERIEGIPVREFRMACKALYLFAARVSEVVGRGYPYETVYGIRGSDVFLDYYRMGGERVDAVVFRVKTAKRRGITRNIALPPDYEPWAEELYHYFQEHGDDYVFPFTRQKLWRETKPHFKGLTYYIDRYPYVDKTTGKVKWKEAHYKTFTLHALRHLRAVELVESYGFDGVSITAYCGRTMRTAQAQFGVSVPKVMARYLYLNWQLYFPKLLKKRW